MADHESLQPPVQKIEFDPKDFGFDPESPDIADEANEAVLDMSEGDLILFVLERQLRITEHDHKGGVLPLDSYYQKSDQLYEAIDERRRALWLEPRPRPY